MLKWPQAFVKLVGSWVIFYLRCFFPTASEFPCLPKQVAWILATNKVFMYPELLPICSLKANNPRDKTIFTKAEDKYVYHGDDSSALAKDKDRQTLEREAWGK